MSAQSEDGVGVGEDLNVPLDWSSTTSLPVLAANQLLIQVDVIGGRPDSVILTIGHANMPPVAGTPDEQRRELQKLRAVPVQAVARVSITRARLDEWVDALTRAGHALDQQFGSRGEGTA